MLSRIFYILYLCLIGIPLFFVSTVLAAGIAIIGCFMGFQKIFGYYPGVIWSRIALAIFLCPVRIENKEFAKDLEKAIIMPNHQSALDIFLVYGYLGIPFRFMLKESLQKIPLIGEFCKIAGFVFVNESNIDSVKKSMADSKKILERGDSLLIFPEGHRTKTGELMPLKRGGFRLAYSLRAQILPIALSYSFEALPHGHRIPRPHRLKMKILPPLDLEWDLTEGEAIDKAQKLVFNNLYQAIEHTPV